MSQCCKLCGQPLPEAPRKDPPLPPLDHPAVVTIHDLPPEERAKAEVVTGAGVGSQSYGLEGFVRTLKLLRDEPK